MSEQAIEKYLAILISQPVSSITRAANMACFGFGEKVLVKNHKGEMIEVSNIALHIQCAWKLAKRKTVPILLARTDMYEPKSSDVWTPDFDWGIQGNNLFDEKAESWLKSVSGVFVKDFSLTSWGEVFLDFSNDDFLHIFIDGSERECWRLFEYQSDRKHLVVSGSEITF